jgi:hypothetical protein
MNKSYRTISSNNLDKSLHKSFLSSWILYIDFPGYRPVNRNLNSSVQANLNSYIREGQNCDDSYFPLSRTKHWNSYVEVCFQP